MRVLNFNGFVIYSQIITFITICTRNKDLVRIISPLILIVESFIHKKNYFYQIVDLAKYEYRQLGN